MSIKPTRYSKKDKYMVGGIITPVEPGKISGVPAITDYVIKDASRKGESNPDAKRELKETNKKLIQKYLDINPN